MSLEEHIMRSSQVFFTSQLRIERGHARMSQGGDIMNIQYIQTSSIQQG